MSKEIFLYSEDKKYKCCFELTDSLDKFKCPDHSVMILFEERKDANWFFHNKEREVYVYESDYEMGVSDAMLDVLFDLIQAGLVEKVVNK